MIYTFVGGLLIHESVIRFNNIKIADNGKKFIVTTDKNESYMFSNTGDGVRVQQIDNATWKKKEIFYSHADNKDFDKLKYFLIKISEDNCLTEELFIQYDTVNCLFDDVMLFIYIRAFDEVIKIDPENNDWVPCLQNLNFPFNWLFNKRGKFYKQYIGDSKTIEYVNKLIKFICDDAEFPEIYRCQSKSTS